VFCGVQRFRTVSRKPFLNRGTVRRGDKRGTILEFVKFAYERKNMLLHIFCLEAKAPPKRPAMKASGCKSRERSARRVEDIIGKASAVAERTPVMPQTVLLRAEVSPAPQSMSAGRGSKDRSVLDGGFAKNGSSVCYHHIPDMQRWCIPSIMKPWASAGEDKELYS
jgi:hypothetical protein